MQQQRCLFPEKEKATKMIKRAVEKVDKCDPISVVMKDRKKSIHHHSGTVIVVKD